MVKVYLAGKFSARERLKPIRQWLNENGFECKSTWLDISAEETDPLGVGKTTYATEDLRQIDEVDLLLIDTFDVSQTGGREFEAGYGYSQNKPFYVIGPLRQIFHNLAALRFESWDQAKVFLREVADAEII